MEGEFPDPFMSFVMFLFCFDRSKMSTDVVYFPCQQMLP